MIKKRYQNLVNSAMCLAIAIVLPFLTGQIPEIGKALAPMHIPVLLCGFICGPIWGGAVGVIAPLLRSALFGAPVFPVSAVPMAVELAAYGFMTGILYYRLPKRVPFIYVSLISSMIFGRVVSGIAKVILYAARSEVYTFSAFIAASVTNAVPGIICHIILIPLIVIALRRTKVISE